MFQSNIPQFYLRSLNELHVLTSQNLILIDEKLYEKGFLDIVEIEKIYSDISKIIVDVHFSYFQNSFFSLPEIHQINYSYFFEDYSHVSSEIKRLLSRDNEIELDSYLSGLEEKINRLDILMRYPFSLESLTYNN